MTIETGSTKPLDTTRETVLEPQEIHDFCNLMGMAPRQLRSAKEAITIRYDLGPRGAWILGLIRQGLTTPTQLTQALKIQRSLMTSELSRLTRAGLVSSDKCPEDGRRLQLALTKKGWAAHRELTVAVTALVLERLKGFSRDDLLTCLAVLERFSGGGTRFVDKATAASSEAIPAADSQADLKATIQR